MINHFVLDIKTLLYTLNNYPHLSEPRNNRYLLLNNDSWKYAFLRNFRREKFTIFHLIDNNPVRIKYRFLDLEFRCNSGFRTEFGYNLQKSTNESSRYIFRRRLSRIPHRICILSRPLCQLGTFNNPLDNLSENTLHYISGIFPPKNRKFDNSHPYYVLPRIKSLTQSFYTLLRILDTKNSNSPITRYPNISHNARLIRVKNTSYQEDCVYRSGGSW